MPQNNNTGTARKKLISNYVRWRWKAEWKVFNEKNCYGNTHQTDGKIVINASHKYLFFRVYSSASGNWWVLGAQQLLFYISFQKKLYSFQVKRSLQIPSLCIYKTLFDNLCDWKSRSSGVFFVIHINRSDYRLSYLFTANKFRAVKF